MNARELASEVDQRGFCVLPAVFSAAECDAMASILHAVWESRGKPSLEGFGIGIHPLFVHAPDISPYYAKPVVLETLTEVLRDEPKLVHTGARVSNETSSEAIGWHDHYSWDAAGVLNRRAPERVLFGCYVRGSNAATGPLVVLPRKVNDPIKRPSENAHADWPGQVCVEAPPGSVVIFDTALFHTAKRGTKPGFRYLWGAHCQGRSNTRPHPEDNTADNEPLRSHKANDPRLKRFLDGD